MFSRTLAIVSAALAMQTLASPLTERAVKVNCLPAGIEASCYSLISSCIGGINTGTKSQLWHNRSCVAAATCYGVGKLEDAVSCQIGASVTNAEQISLDYNTIYAGIVGSCAFATGGCPITQQNYIDFYYGTLSSIGSGSFPSSANIVIAWWQAVQAWTATGNTVPYLNFNDWLHYSTYNSGTVTTSTSQPPRPTTSVSVTPVSPSASTSTVIASSSVPVTSASTSTVIASSSVPVTSASTSTVVASSSVPVTSASTVTLTPTSTVAATPAQSD